MDLANYVGQWKGKEIVAFCGPIKYRGTLMEIMDEGFIVLAHVAIINVAAKETAEYESCLLNMSEVSGIVYQESVGRGGELV
jgi:hypothetical protein